MGSCSAEALGTTNEELEVLLAELAERTAAAEAAGSKLADDLDALYDKAPDAPPPLSEEEQLLLDLELEQDERELCRRKLAEFVQRMQEVHEPFSPNWHIDLMCRELELLVEATLTPGSKLEERRLLIQMPPRHTKSMTVSRCLPIWFLALNPTKEVIVAGYGQEFINEFGDWAKEILQSDMFKAIFPDFQLRKDSNAKNRLKTKEGGGIRYAGAGSAITGRGAHLFVIDDPIKGEKDADSEISSDDLWKWYWGVARTRLHPGGSLVVLHTRWRVNDLIGRLMRQDQEREDRGKGKVWRLLNFPFRAEEDEYDFRTGRLLRRKGEFLHPDRYGEEDWEELEENMPARQLLALYQQKPVADEGNLFKRDNLCLYNPADLPKNLIWYLATDLAVEVKQENDFSCIWPYGVDQHGNIWWHPDFFHNREDTGKLVNLLLDYAIRFDVMHIDMEKGVIKSSIRPGLELAMRKRKRFFSIESPDTGKKDKRAKAQSAVSMTEMSMMYFPNTSRVNLVAIPELLAFDKGDHDDIVDTIAIAALNSDKHVRPNEELFDGDEDLEDPEDDEDEEFEEKPQGIPSLFSADW